MENSSVNNLSESELVEQVRAGNAGAFENLFKIYCQPLINFAQRYVNDTQTAENIVQDVFVKIWQNRENLNPSSNIKSYLYIAARNQSLKHLRHLKIVRRSEEDVEKFEKIVATPEDNYDERVIATSIQKAVDRLPEKCRLIFSLNRYNRLTYREIAEIQNISIKTVETQMGRALKFLRSSLSHFLTGLLL